MSHTMLRSFFILILVLSQWSSAAAAPTNDNFAGAERIAAIPFAATLDVSEATLEANEPQNCTPSDRTVWYSFVPSATMTLVADARLGSGGTINIYRATGSGITSLEPVQCVSSGGAITFLVEAGQTYYLQVGAPAGEPGNVQFSLSQLVEITGYVIDASTGAPLPGNVPPFATVNLLRVCGDGCLEFIRGVVTFDDGQFRIQSYLGDEVPPGTYMLEIFASGYQTQQFGPYEFTGANLDVGVLALEPIPTIRSIRGRLIETATGKPVPDIFTPVVELYRCINGDCFMFMNGQIPDSEGRFHFETDNFGNPLVAGTYLVVAFADQYHLAQTELFDVTEGAQKNLGSLRIRSHPVRFSDVVPCPDMPSSGGECAYSVRIWNGLGTKLEGNVWSLASSSLPTSPIGVTEFQIKEPKNLVIQQGKSKVVQFKFEVPPSDEAIALGICTRVFVGRGGNPFFNTIGYRDLFCVLRNAEGFTIVPPQTQASARDSAPLAANGTNVELNNTCQEAQDVSAVPFPFTVDGSLDSSVLPDVDYYRFSGTAGAVIIIDLAGQFTGQGTLPDPLLGAFDSSCSLITLNDDFNSPNSRLVMSVPDDGTFILAATAYPDSEFLGGGNGTYQLTISPFRKIGSISGKVTNAATGDPLSGDPPLFAFAILQQCNEFGCNDLVGQAAGSDGSFRFDSDFNGVPLEEGTYRVVAGAEQFQFGQTESFDVHEGEDVDVGAIGLQPFPVQFIDTQPCAIPSDGGVCEFSVTVTNTLPTPLSGKVWSIVNAYDIGSFLNFTTFQPDTPRDIRLGAGQSRTLRFRFRVSGRVPDGAVICPMTYMGQNPDPLFHPVGRAFLFCLVKGGVGFTLMSPTEAQAAVQQMQIQKFAPPPLFTDKKK
jgi:5-hydroxyisourate hydrolase-like protein (transthyretin family)